MSLLSPVERLRQITGTGARYLFIAQSPVYLCILLALQRRRQAHEIEVLHDDLLAEVTEPAARLAGGYDAQAFRAHLVQLQEWGNVSERVEPTRIRSLADRGRSKLLLRIDAETAAFLSFLESRLDAAAVGVREEGLNLLADIEEGLRDALASLRRARGGGAEAGDAADEDHETDGRVGAKYEADGARAGVERGAAPAQTGAGVERGAAPAQPNAGVERGAAPAQTDSGVERGAAPAQTDPGVERGAAAARAGLEDGPVPAPADAGPRSPSAASDAHLARAAHLVREADARAERVAEELVRVSDALASFVAEPFRLARIAEVGGFLEAYLERYLAVLDARGHAIRRTLKVLAGPRHREAWARAGALERERVLALGASVAAADPPEIVARLSTFFGGRLEALCGQVNRRTRDVIRRLQRHVEALRLRNVRTETIRARAAELFERARRATAQEGAGAGEDDALAFAWLDRLVASARVITDERDGSPAAKATPPRPARRHETRRPSFRGDPLLPKQGSPQETRALELRRLQVLSAFVEERILRGRAAARLSEAQLVDLADARRVVAAFSAHTLRGGRHRVHLGYRLERADGRAVLAAGDLVLDAPEMHVRRRP